MIQTSYALRKHLIPGIALLLGLMTVISGCRQSELSQTSLESVPLSATPPPTSPPTPAIAEAQLLAVGDIMMHLPQTQSGYNPQTKTYNFDGFFTEVKPILSQGDWVIGNLETPLAGASARFTGYPLFNAPDELADALKGAGFNILTTANNHSLDRQELGVINTLVTLRNRGIIAVGTALSAVEAQDIITVEKKGISMALLAYTYGTNGIPIPQGKDYLVSLIDEPKIVKDILAARRMGVDLVTVALHFGDEYQRHPNQGQKQLVQQLVGAGADIILGSHPHVVQPYQIFEVPTQQGKTRKAVAIYSMGNFISNQVGNDKDLGVIFAVNVEKQLGENTTEIKEVEAIPTWVHRYRANGQLNYRVLPLESVIMAKNDPLLVPGQYSQLEQFLNRMNDHIHSLNPAFEIRVSTP